MTLTRNRKMTTSPILSSNSKGLNFVYGVGHNRSFIATVKGTEWSYQERFDLKGKKVSSEDPRFQEQILDSHLRYEALV
jgi:hypothetical protein